MQNLEQKFVSELYDNRTEPFPITRTMDFLVSQEVRNNHFTLVMEEEMEPTDEVKGQLEELECDVHNTFLAQLTNLFPQLGDELIKEQMSLNN